MYSEDLQVKEMELKNASESLNIASTQRVELNEKHRELLHIYYDKIALYSASAISFTITIIGFVLSSKLKIYTNNYFVNLFPLIYLLYITWIAFGIAFISAIIGRKLDAYYISAYGAENYVQKLGKFEKKKSEFANEYPDMITFTDNADNISVDKWAEGREETALAAAKKAAEFKEEKEKYFWLFNKSRLFAEVFALIGTVSLIIFSIFTTQSLLK